MANKDINIIVGVKNATKKAFGLIGKKVKSLGSIVKSVSTGLAKAFRGVRNFSIAAAGGITALVKTANDFRKTMAEVGTIAGRGNIKELTSQIIDLSAELGIAKNELAKGLYQTLSQGVPTGNAIDFLRKSAKAAIAGVTSTEDSVLALTKVINAYKLNSEDASRVSDMMFTTVKNGGVVFRDLAVGIGQVAGFSAEAGVGLEELFGVLANASKVVNPRQLFTGLRATLVGLTRPTEDLQKVFRKMGTTGEELVKTKGISGALDAITKATGGSIEKLGKFLPSVEALPVVLAIAGRNAGMTKKQIEAMGAAMGATAEAFDIMNEVRGWNRLWQQMLRPVTKMGIVFDKELSPSADKIGKAIEKWQASESFMQFIENTKDALKEITSLTEDLFAGGDRRQEAIAKIKEVGATIGDFIAEKGVAIGEQIAIGIIKGTGKAIVGGAKGVVRQSISQDVGLASLQAGGGKISTLERMFPVASNIISGGAFAGKVRTEELLRDIRDGINSLKEPDGG